MTNSVTQQFSIEQIQSAFDSLVPALSKRLHSYARKFSDAEESFAEMFSNCWVNFRQKSMRGVLLPANQLAYMAYIRLASGRTLTGYSTVDVHAPQAFKLGRCRRIFLSEVENSRVNEALPDSVTKHIVQTLSTREWDTPLVRAMTRIDWTAFSKTLPRKMRRLLICLVVGFSKGDAAIRLRVSPGRISQMLRVLGDKVEMFFGPEIVPVQ